MNTRREWGILCLALFIPLFIRELFAYSIFSQHPVLSLYSHIFASLGGVLAVILLAMLFNLVRKRKFYKPSILLCSVLLSFIFMNQALDFLKGSGNPPEVYLFWPLIWGGLIVFLSLALYWFINKISVRFF